MTSAKENYLKVIFVMVSNGQQAQVSQIAAKLNVTRASVSRTIKSLQKEGLINHHNYGPVYLTIDGMKIAKMLINRNRTIQDFLTNLLEIDSDTAQKDACQIEHTISHITTVQLAKYLQTIYNKNN